MGKRKNFTSAERKFGKKKVSSLQRCKGLKSDLAKLRKRILDLHREKYQGNYISRLMEEGYDYYEIYWTVKQLRAEGKLKS